MAEQTTEEEGCMKLLPPMGWAGRLVLILALLLCLVFAVALVVLPARAEAFPCRANGKEMPAQTCAFINMNEYIVRAYFAPTMQTFWVKQTSVGKFHSRWLANVPTPNGLFVKRRVTISASRCRNTFVIFDHRKQQWSSRC